MSNKLLKMMTGLTAIVAATVTPLAAHADIKIGAIVASSGGASFLGDPEAKTLKMYVDSINANGGVNGEKIDLILYDDAADPNKARTFATRLIEEDEVVAAIGTSTTGSTMAIIPLFQDAQIPLISLAGGDPITDPVKKWVFAMPHSAKMACGKIFEDIKARGLSKIAMISGTGGFGKSMQAKCKEIAPGMGIEILADETYGPKDQDMTPQLTNIKNTAGVQAVVNPGFGQGPAIVTRNFKQLGISVPLYQSHGVASKSFIQLAGDAAEGIRLPAANLLVVDKLPADDPQLPVVKSYRDTYEKATGEPVSTFGGYAYDALQILVAAMKKAGTDSAGIRDAIEQTKGYMGTSGVVNMTPENHIGLDLSAFKMVEIKDGDWSLVK